MKQLKFLAIAFSLLLSVAFTSCMDSGTDSKPQGVAIVEVKESSMMGMTYFQMGETTLYPTSSSLAAVGTTNGFKPSSTDIAYVLYEYDPESADNANFQTTKKLTVDLRFAISLDATSHVITTPGSANDSVATAPIIELSKSAVEVEKEFAIIGNRYLVAGINYYLTGQKMHTFTLICYPDEITSDSEDLKLYLRHRSKETDSFTGGDMSSAKVGGQYPSLFYYAFDINGAIDNFTMKTKKAPNNIIIETEVNANGVKLSDAEKKTYTVTYKSGK